MTAIEDIAARIGPSVVGMQDGTRGGAGVLVAPGIVATLARNVHRDELTLVTGDGATHAATVVGVDPSVDLAVLRTEAPAPAATWSTADAAPRLGVKVYALADPGGRGLRVTGGTVASAPRGVRGPAGRLIPDAIEHTAPLPRGAGGGPLVDRSGAIVGLNALRRDGGLLLAWPATALRDRATALASGERTAPRRLGIALVGARQTGRMRAAVGLDPVDGLLVRGVKDGSPADRAGITRGDVVVGANGTAVTGLDDLHGAVDAAGPGPLELDLLRGTDRLTLRVEGEEVEA